MIKLYSTESCPRCKVVKLKLNNLGINYELCSDVDEMTKMGISTVPVLELENGDKLGFVEILNWIKEAVN